MGNYLPVILDLKGNLLELSSMTETSFDDGHFLNLKPSPPTSSDSCCRNFCASLTVSQESRTSSTYIDLSTVTVAECFYA